MGPKWLLSEAILQSASFGFRGVHGGHSASMAGAKGRSDGRRAAGAGRKPGATTQIKMPKSKGINKASTSGRWPLDANATKLVTVFFDNASSCAAVWLQKMCVHRPRSRGPKPRGFHWHCSACRESRPCCGRHSRRLFAWGNYLFN